MVGYEEWKTIPAGRVFLKNNIYYIKLTFDPFNLPIGGDAFCCLHDGSVGTIGDLIDFTRPLSGQIVVL